MNPTLSALLAVLYIPEVFYTLGTAVTVILADVAAGILAAFVTNTFDARKLPSFLRQNVLPYLGTLVLLALFSAQPEMKVLFFTSAAAVVAKFLADITNKVATMIGFDPKAVPTAPPQGPSALYRQDVYAEAPTRSVSSAPQAPRPPTQG